MGGSSKGTVAPELAKPISTTNNIGSELSVEAGTIGDEEESQIETVNKAKMGTRGLRIPKLTSNKSSTRTASNSGVSI